MLKKLSVLFSLTVLALLCSIGASAGFLLDDKPYVEDEKTKIIDHVVYKLYEYPKGNRYYEVYDWFDTYEASETVEEINIVPEIDGIKVTKIQNIEPLSDPEYWKNKNYSVKKVTIPDTITEIGSYFFSVLDGVEELTIPASVKKFTGDGISGSEMTTFVEMESLKKITFLGNLEELGGFYNCKKLETVVLKGDVDNVTMCAFTGCASLKNFDFSKIKGSVSSYAFSDTGFTSVTIPAKFFRNLAFKDCKKLTEVIITSGKKDHVNLNYGVFYNCTALKTVTLPKSCKDVTVDREAFKNCTSLKTVIFPESCKNFTIKEKMFINCKSLSNVTFPTTCEKMTVNEEAFRNCKALTSVKFPATCKKLTIGNDAFRNCTSLKKVTFPKTTDGVTVGYRGFRNCKNLTTLYYTSNIEKIYGGAFRDCASLTSFCVSDKIKIIGKNAFYNCKKLKTFTINGTTKYPQIYKNAFYNTAKGITFTAKNENIAKKWKSELKASGLKNMKVRYVKYYNV